MDIFDRQDFDVCASLPDAVQFGGKEGMVRTSSMSPKTVEYGCCRGDVRWLAASNLKAWAQEELTSRTPPATALAEDAGENTVRRGSGPRWVMSLTSKPTRERPDAPPEELPSPSAVVADIPVCQNQHRSMTMTAVSPALDGALPSACPLKSASLPLRSNMPPQPTCAPRWPSSAMSSSKSQSTQALGQYTRPRKTSTRTPSATPRTAA
ncbi:hypothetical protein PG993_007006 [Apiospora rasikravindrae]|uniref:Uncharacterized protein n=1 Tax=Apiospora rasikravindrae TaxID=990691 RepID=A0ABR1SWA8_9PEZI